MSREASMWGRIIWKGLEQMILPQFMFLTRTAHFFPNLCLLEFSGSISDIVSRTVPECIRKQTSTSIIPFKDEG